MKSFEINAGKNKEREDLQTSPQRPPARSTNKYLTPPREVPPTAEANKQHWSVDFKGEARTRPVVFRHQLLTKDPNPLVPGMEMQLNKELSKLGTLIQDFKGDIPQETRTKLNIRRKKIDAAIAKTVIQVITLRPETVREEPTIRGSVEQSIKCLNSNSTFMQRLKLIARIESINGIGQNEIASWKNIKDFELIQTQLSFERNLTKLGLSFTPLSRLRLEPEVRTRIIFSDIQKSTIGFEYLMLWIKLCSDPSATGLKKTLKTSGPQKIIDDMRKLQVKDVNFEMAWGHIMNDGRHADEKIVFVTSLETLKNVMELCSPNSTFILDGHGSPTMLSNGKSDFKGPELHRYITKLVDILTENITHVILSVCASGCLTKSASIESARHPNIKAEHPILNKYNLDKAEVEFTARHKNRKKIFVKKHEIEEMFQKLDGGMKTFAQDFAHKLLIRPKQDAVRGTAFSFSPSIIFPDSVYGGVFCVPASTTNRRNWPDYHESWAADETGLEPCQNAFKTITMYNQTNNNKALAENGEWKKLNCIGSPRRRLFVDF